MSIQITILGLDRIGASIGMALGRHSVQVDRIGFDHKHASAMHARKINAVDRVELNLSKSIKQADVVFLTMPLHLVRETLKTIAPDVRAGLVILDTSPAKQNVAAWVRALIPLRFHYLGITPLLDSRYLNNQDESIQSADIDLFENSLMSIASPDGTDPAAIKLAADLCGLLGAAPFFCDMAEMDGFTTSTRLLPQLVSTALLNTTLNQPGWMDASKFSGAEYATVSAGIAGRDESASLREAAILNKTNLLRNLDGMLAALYALRDEIENDQVSQLESKLESAREGRLKWWHERQRMDPLGKEFRVAEMPKAADFWKQQMGFLSRLSGSHNSKPEKKDKPD